MSKTYFFKATTENAHSLKCFIELASHNLTDIFLTITANGIKSERMDDRGRILLITELDMKRFFYYKYNQIEPTHIGLNLTNFKNAVKGIRKKDSVEFCIYDNDRGTFHIKINPKSNGSISRSIKVQTVQLIDIEIPNVTSTPVSVSSGGIYNAINGIYNAVKEVEKNSAEVVISISDNTLRFTCNNNVLVSSAAEIRIDDDYTNLPLYQETFYMKQLVKLIKLFSLGSHVKMYIQRPLMFEATVGVLGTVRVFVNTKADIINHDMSVNADV